MRAFSTLSRAAYAQQSRFLSLWNPYHFGTIKPFLLPDLGEKIKEATVKKIYVKEGDIVEEFQTIADVATDKLFTQIPSAYSGKIHKIHHQEEDTCLVGGVFVEIEVDDGTAPAAAAAAAATTTTTSTKESSSTQQTPQSTKQHSSEEAQSKSTTASSTSGVLATPVVRALAKEHKVELSQVHGTGAEGRILKSDVLAFLEKPKKPAATSSHKKAFEPTSSTSGTQHVKMTDFMKGMQKTMTESNTIPHLYLKEEYDLTALAALRESIKASQNTSITFMTFFIKAFSLALRDFPLLNSLYDVNKPFEYTLVKQHNISLAVDSPKGLVVPNIKNVDALSIMDIQAEIKRLVKSAEAGTLGAKDLFDGSICISNIGTIGGTYTGPLILPPQTTIVGLGRVQTLPRYINKSTVKGVEDLALEPRKIMNVSFGCDHRVIDGASVTKFSNKWKSYLEDPSAMLLHLK